MPVSLREYLQRAAEREMITQAAVVRRLVAEDARRSERRDERAPDGLLDPIRPIFEHRGDDQRIHVERRRLFNNRHRHDHDCPVADVEC
jgi:hypothetical protein